MNQEPITTTTEQVIFLAGANILLDHPLDTPDTEAARHLGVRRGEVAEIQKRTKQLYPRPSRFASTQPDGSWKYIAWTARYGDEPQVEVVSRWKWTGKIWKQIGAG